MKNLLAITSNFSGKKIIVVGDVMLDKYISGDVSRISPEAPIPVIKVERESFSAGGAANVAANIKTLGGNAVLFGFLGNDDAGKKLTGILAEKEIKFYSESDSSTTLKVRVIGRNQQFVRMDYESQEIKKMSGKMRASLLEEAADSDAIIVSDYAKGTVTPELMRAVLSAGKRVIIDPKPSNFQLYFGCFLLTPNEKEALEISGKSDFTSAGRYIRAKSGANVIITRGEKGMALFSDKEMEIPTYAQEVYDVSGAGDTVISALALSLASNASLEQAAIISNHAAGISVSKAGTYQVKLSKLESKLSGEEKKVRTFQEIIETVSDLKLKGKKIVWTNGCFDLLHEGHVKYLSRARSEGDCLIVGINSDSSIQRIKGSSRPIRPESARAEILSALGCVDYVLVFSEDSPARYLEAFRPDVYAKGGDYNIETINQQERRIVEGYGGKIAIIQLKEDISTTALIERIRNSH